MSFNVSSWFIEQVRAPIGSPKRRFTIGGSDYSHAVIRWPSLGFKAGTIDLGTTTVVLGNVDNSLSFFVGCDHFLTTSCEITMGFSHPDSGEEAISLFIGTPSNLVFARDGKELRIQLQGKTKRLTDTSLGTDTESGGVDFTNSANYPSDLAWTLITCYGRMSSLESDANPDVQYSEWADWRDANRVRDIRVKAYLKGERIFQVLNTLATMDGRIISFQNGKLRFRDPFESFDPKGPSFPLESILDLSVSLNPERITNHFFVEANYDPETSRFKAQFSQVNSASQAVFGTRSGRFSSRGVWFSSARDAQFLVGDRIRFGARPLPEVHVKAPLGGAFEISPGDLVSLTHSGFGWEKRLFRVVEQSLNLDTALVDLQLSEAQHRRWQFESTVSSFSLYTPHLVRAGSDALLGLGEQGGARPVLRNESGGYFQATGLYATALLAINETELLLGGPPSSGSPQGLLQRSSDAGSSAVTVSSLAVNLSRVHHIFEVRSGSYLASANSGAIYRSTDGGSSWNHTQTISGAYHINKFFQPFSGTLWGATGYSNFAFGKGLFIWESQDDGISWSRVHIVQDSGNYYCTGIHPLPDSEYLLSTFGGDITEIGVWRSKTTSPTSIGWTLVLSGGSFSEIVITSSGHLLFGFFEETTLNGGAIYRSLDQGSAWIVDAQLTKQGNIALIVNSDSTLDAYVSRMSVGTRTDRYRNFDPNQLG